MENEKIETWFAELYRLSMMGKLSINELYAEFKKAINGTQNETSGKIHPYFYSREWSWGKELDGCYYRAVDVDDQLAQQKALLDDAVKVIEFYANKDNYTFSYQDAELDDYNLCVFDDKYHESTDEAWFGGKRAMEFLEKVKK